MSDVVDIRARRADQHAEGEAFCLQCQHVWHAVAPTGTIFFECPECHTMKGLFRYAFDPGEGRERRECACGCQLFFMTPVGHMCPNCGIYQEYDDG